MLKPYVTWIQVGLSGTGTYLSAVLLQILYPKIRGDDKIFYV